MTEPNTCRRVLVADDEEEIRYSFELALTIRGYDVVSVADGTQLLDALEAAGRAGKKFDVIVSDFRMPGIAGKELFQKILRFEDFPPVLIMSGFHEKELVEEMLDLGCVDYLEKPFDIEFLLQKIASVVET